MSPSWPNFWVNCKSRFSAIGRSCYLGRSKWRANAKSLRSRVVELELELKSLQTKNQQSSELIQQLRMRIAELSQAKSEADSARASNLSDRRPSGCHYSVELITLAVNLARCLGLRPTVRAMKVVFEWLGRDQQLPSYQTIRIWMQRMGYNRMTEAKKMEGATWLVDHTIQMGKEKVLTITRVKKSNSLLHGKQLKHKDLEVLATVPGSHWKHSDVQLVYEQTAQRYGFPKAIVSDGASDLQRPAEMLESEGKKAIVLYDLKHYLANQFKNILLDDPQYANFTEQLKHTCASIQQTELAHFIPRVTKRKARFMNMGPILEWAVMALWQLDHPNSQSRKGISTERMNEKLGWLRNYRTKILQWRECQTVIDLGVRLVGRQGLSHGTAEQFSKAVTPQANSPVSLQLVRIATEFLASQEAKLTSHDRLVMSTEILESSFALFKELEKQHSKEGFTGLLLGFSTLLKKVTPEEVLRAFSTTKVAHIKQWTQKHLSNTLPAKRQAAFRETRLPQSRNTKKCATALAA